jgi:hypothetical protein
VSARLEHAQRTLRQAQDTLKGFYAATSTADREKALCEALEGVIHVAGYLLQELMLAEIGRRSRDELEHNRSYVDSTGRGWR